MANRFLLSVTLMSFLMTPVITHACDTTEKNILEIEKAALSGLNSGKTEGFNSRTGDCKPLNGTQKGIKVKELIASDETTRVNSQYYFDTAENRDGVLKNTLGFNINEEESQRTSDSSQGIRDFDINEE